MSWDSYETKKTCPCGVGTYTVVDRSNDWGQSDSQWVMDCPSCKMRYALHSFDIYPHGLHAIGHRWVLREDFELASNLKAQAESLMRLALERARERYLKNVCDYFSKMPKKKVWEKINSLIISYKSLGTFYRQTKGILLADYLSEEVFSESNISVVWFVLSHCDKEIEDILKDASALKEKSRGLLVGS